ncbi:MAG: sugar ABC transporter permease [Alphaproteobacteria bacterium]|nr:sugar ABC transporter permease [Alphaproteobacteria bacterium]
MMASFFKNYLKALGPHTRILVMLLVLAIIFIVFDFISQGTFITPRNLFNLAVQSTVVAIMATGMVLVIVTRHIDLSVGSILGFTGMVTAFLQTEIFFTDNEWGWIASIICGLVVGILIGMWNGYWIAYKAIPSFVVTLGGLLIFRGATFTLSEGETISSLHPNFMMLGGGLSGSIGPFWSWVVAIFMIALIFYSMMANRHRRKKVSFITKSWMIEIITFVFLSVLIIGFVMLMNAYKRPDNDLGHGIPVPVLILMIVALAISFMATKTKLGRYIFAIGGNPEAAALSGINVKKVTVIIFALMGALCAIASVVATARLGSATNAAGELAELKVIAAAVIGGTSLAGGVGTVFGAIVGAVIMQSLESGMSLLDVAPNIQKMVIGMVLILAVWIDMIYLKNKR